MKKENKGTTSNKDNQLSEKGRINFKLIGIGLIAIALVSIVFIPISKTNKDKNNDYNVIVSKKDERKAKNKRLEELKNREESKKPLILFIEGDKKKELTNLRAVSNKYKDKVDIISVNYKEIKDIAPEIDYMENNEETLIRLYDKDNKILKNDLDLYGKMGFYILTKDGEDYAIEKHGAINNNEIKKIVESI